MCFRPEIIEPTSSTVAQVPESSTVNGFVCTVRVRDRDYGTNATVSTVYFSLL